MIHYEMNKYEFFDVLLKTHGSERMPYSAVGCDLIFNHINETHKWYRFDAAAIRGEYTEYLSVDDLILDTCGRDYVAASRLQAEYQEYLTDGFCESAALELTVPCRIHEYFVDLNTNQVHIIARLR